MAMASPGTGYRVANKGVHFGWQWGENQAIFGQLTDNGYVWARHDFETDNSVFALDKYGINHGFLMNGCRRPSTSGPTRGGLRLPLNGTINMSSCTTRQRLQGNWATRSGSSGPGPPAIRESGRWVTGPASICI